jgi:hypothetical protein
LDSHPEDPAVIDGVRVSIMEAAVTFLSNPIGPKHGMPFRQLDSAFFYQELKKLVSFGPRSPSSAGLCVSCVLAYVVKRSS